MCPHLSGWGEVNPSQAMGLREGLPTDNFRVEATALTNLVNSCEGLGRDFHFTML